MTVARCSCGALTLTLPGPSKWVVACHCLDCQRRTGAPFGVGAFYPVDAVVISGAAKAFTREAASGGKVHTYFCPNCGSTIYWKADNLASLIGVAVGAADESTNLQLPSGRFDIRNMIRSDKTAHSNTSSRAARSAGSRLTPAEAIQFDTPNAPRRTLR